MVEFGKFVHTKTGRNIMSLLLGFGLACLFRKVCDKKECVQFFAPPLEEIKNKIFKSGTKCVQYSFVSQKCETSKKIVPFK